MPLDVIRDSFCTSLGKFWKKENNFYVYIINENRRILGEREREKKIIIPIFKAINLKKQQQKINNF